MINFDEILETIKKDCCNKTFILSAIKLKSITDKRNTIHIEINNKLHSFFVDIISNYYGNINISFYDNMLMLTGNITTLLEDVKAFDIDKLKPCCKLIYLKTLFMISSNFYFNNDTTKYSVGYNLEFYLNNEEILNKTINLLKLYNLNFKKNERGNIFIVYSKDSEIICNFLVLIKYMSLSFEIENQLIVRDMRNDANRQSNCIKANINKTINASATQLEAIEYISKNYTLDYLNEDLREIAVLRLSNPNETLNELVSLYGKKITRAGLKYKFDKIIKIYNILKEKEN